MKNLPKILAGSLKDSERIAVLGIGSELRADDAAGLLVIANIKNNPKTRKLPVSLKTFYGSTAPENLTGEIRKYKPTHIIMVDSIDAGKSPGSIVVIDPDNISGASFSSHQLPLKILVDYFLKLLACKVLIIGIQPKSLEFSGIVSKKTIQSALRVSDALISALQAP